MVPEDWQSLTTHGAAHIAPLMSEEEFNKLCESMKTYGFFNSHPITLFEGKILDGRNRWEAAIQSGVTPHFTEYEGNDPYWFSWYSNVESRRMLTHAQRAIAAARMAQAMADDRKAAALAAGYSTTQAAVAAHRIATEKHRAKGQGAAPAPSVGIPEAGKATAIAAKKSGIPERTIAKVLEVKREAPEIYADLESGKIPTVQAAQDALKQKQNPTAIAQEHGKKNADVIKDVKETTADDHVIRERWLNIKSQVHHLSKDIKLAATNCRLSDDELTSILDFLNAIQAERSAIVIDVVK